MATPGHRDDCLCIQCGLLEPLAEAERKAWDSLSRYKFQMFGYWAAIWVHLNHVGRFARPNPFKELVRGAKEHRIK